jgi:hypothetical protein
MLYDVLQWLVNYISIMFFICFSLKYSYMYVVMGVVIKVMCFLFLLFVLKSVVIFKTKPACLNIRFSILTIWKGMWM